MRAFGPPSLRGRKARPGTQQLDRAPKASLDRQGRPDRDRDPRCPSSRRGGPWTGPRVSDDVMFPDSERSPDGSDGGGDGGVALSTVEVHVCLLESIRSPAREEARALRAPMAVALNADSGHNGVHHTQGTFLNTGAAGRSLPSPWNRVVPPTRSGIAFRAPCMLPIPEVMLRYAGFRGVTWDAERYLHLLSISSPIAPGALMICGKELPQLIIADTECEPGVIEKGMCPRCDKTFWKVWRRRQDDFAADVARDLEQLQVTNDIPLE